ncbi:MAG: lysostaphin resistance A-like protein [Pseudanabaenaceae cyanobacterium]
MIWLYCLFVWFIGFWGRRIEEQPRPYHYYGLRWDRRALWELLLGLAIGVGSYLLLLQIQVWLDWAQWQYLNEAARYVLPGLVLGLAVGVAEELLFRGWLLTELERDYSPNRSLWISTTIFAVCHFLSWEAIVYRWTQFWGLLLLGRNLVLARRLTKGGLALPIGFHAGLVWAHSVVDMGRLFMGLEEVPSIITGIRGNPLAGLLGLLFLLGLGKIADVLLARQKKGKFLP